MKICPKCNANLDDSVKFCQICGCDMTGVEAQYQASQEPQFNEPQYQPQYNQTPQYTQPQYQPAVDPYDHTSEFDAKDISDNKVMALMIYVGGIIGVIIALLAANNSPYVGFHLRQYLKFFLVETVATIVGVILCWTFIVPIAAIGLAGALLVFRIICIVQICKGQAKEGLLVRKLGFLK